MYKKLEGKKKYYRRGGGVYRRQESVAIWRCPVSQKQVVGVYTLWWYLFLGHDLKLFFRKLIGLK